MNIRILFSHVAPPDEVLEDVVREIASQIGIGLHSGSIYADDCKVGRWELERSGK